MVRLLRPAFGIAAVFFLLAPLLAILPLAFNQGTMLNYPMTGVSTRWFVELFTADAWRRAIVNSLVIGLGSAGLATVLGTLAALGLRGRATGFYRLCNMLFLLPMVAPLVVLGVGMQLMFSRMGLNNTHLGVIVAHTVIAVPFVVISVSTALAGIDPTVERASASLGASRSATFRHVTLPLAMPGVLSGAVFAFATSLDEVVLLLFLGGVNQRTLSREMFAQLRDNLSPTLASAAFVFIIGTICISLVAVVTRRAR